MAIHFFEEKCFATTQDSFFFIFGGNGKVVDSDDCRICTTDHCWLKKCQMFLAESCLPTRGSHFSKSGHIEHSAKQPTVVLVFDSATEWLYGTELAVRADLAYRHTLAEQS